MVRKYKWLRVKIKRGVEGPTGRERALGSLLEHLRYAGLISYRWRDEDIVVQFRSPPSVRGSVWAEQNVARIQSFLDEVEVFTSEREPWMVDEEVG